MAVTSCESLRELLNETNLYLCIVCDESTLTMEDACLRVCNNGMWALWLADWNKSYMYVSGDLVAKIASKNRQFEYPCDVA